MSEPRPVQFTEAEAAEMHATLIAARAKIATLERRSAELEAALSWRRVVPSTPGLYLRRNPRVTHVVREFVIEIDGELTVAGEGLQNKRLKTWEGAKIMWWFGPIPECPDEEPDAALAPPATQGATKEGGQRGGVEGHAGRTVSSDDPVSPAVVPTDRSDVIGRHEPESSPAPSPATRPPHDPDASIHCKHGVPFHIDCEEFGMYWQRRTERLNRSLVEELVAWRKADDVAFDYEPVLEARRLRRINQPPPDPEPSVKPLALPMVQP